jgi:Zn/Cd-binding protein ZinT
MSEPKAIRIEIEYDDGLIEFAEGDAAEQIVSWYKGCEVMNCVHGARYRGQRFEERRAAGKTPEGRT